MNELFLFPTAIRNDPAVEDWMRRHPDALGEMAREWF